ncbi:Tudor and KH domain-containing protein [Pseudolycoriella hygida]|uniref:Tudor and KH domain-containing protein n=1 Tax=Pseudolycoriella hygida TaxID=35572 RepID=A0A9Q0NBZ1_9DIPT|nr:Tudor and KH domain-containing protein [Pseudolycoriella hygida]
MNMEEDQILAIHSAFLLEYNEATHSLKEFFENVISFFTRISSEEYIENKSELQDNIQSLQDVCFFLKTLSSEAQLHSEILNSKSKKPQITDEEINHSFEVECDFSENPNQLYPYELYPEIFTYKSIEPSKYCVGQEEEFLVSHIKDEASLLFFLLKLSPDIVTQDRPEFRFDDIPAVGQVFGLLLDGTIVRAVRENILNTQKISFKAFLIDFGEILIINKDFKMYRLPKELQEIPGQAIFCKLSVQDDDDDSSIKNLQTKLHTSQKVRVTRVYKNMLEVSFLSSFTSTKLTKNSNPNILSNVSERNTPSTKTEPVLKNGTVTANPNLLDKQQKKNSSLTEEELKELFEETPTTDNALQAVMGYIPKDEQRICKYYDEKTKACFKGSNCTLEHTTILKDGWTKDQTIIKLKIHAQIPTIPVGKKINLYISYVYDVDKFYAQIIHKNCKNTNDLVANQIFDKIEKKAHRLKKYDQPPGECELVFAKFHDEWYRAKILHKLSDVNFRVFYVDYGNCGLVNFNDLRQWDSEFDSYPFQALECKLDNITKLKNRDAVAISFLEHIVLNNAVTATVTCNVGMLYVTLEDHEKFDIGEQLIAAKFAVPKPVTKFGKGSFPG